MHVEGKHDGQESCFLVGLRNRREEGPRHNKRRGGGEERGQVMEILEEASKERERDWVLCCQSQG